MRAEQFVESRRERWTELDALVKRGAAHGLNRLSGDDLMRLGRLYRAATSDLAIAQRDFPTDRTTLYLNALLARAHPLVYQQRSVDMSRVGWFLRYGFPEAYRTALPYIAVAFGIFALSAIVSALLVFYQPSNADTLLPRTAQELRSVMQHHHLWVKSATSNHSVAANFIMLNNIQVAFFAFAGGLLAGAGTVLVLVQNGILFGGVMAMAAQFRLGEQLWAFIIPHGVVELSVIFMAGGAGLMVGDAILRPGLLTRREALMRAADVAIRLVLGAVPLLVVAGTIEGFLSPSDAPNVLKLAVGLVTGTLLYS
jgi:uncharacterized membrane protein SpoIIM required for sporulation